MGSTLHAEKMPAIPALTSLRFFAAFVVLLLHASDSMGSIPAWFLRMLFFALYSVSFFFILSGFILTYNYQSWFYEGVNKTTFWKFQKLRFARIYPMYVIGLLLDTLFHVIERTQTGQLADSGLDFWASWVINLVGLEAWIPATPYQRVLNTPAWSVSAEFFFYATFPFVIFYLTRKIQKESMAIILMVITVLVGTLISGVIIYLLDYQLKVDGTTSFIIVTNNPLLRYAEFFAGCIAGMYFLRTNQISTYRLNFLFNTKSARNILILICSAIILLRVYQYPYTGPSTLLRIMDNAIKYSFSIIPFCLIIIAIAKGPNFLTCLLEKPWLVLLGEASYCLYITHWPVISFIDMSLPDTNSTPLTHIFFVIAIIPLSIFFYRFIETPMREKISGKRKS